MSEQLSREYLISLAHEYGTPLYVYHAEKIKEQYDKLRSAFTDCNARFFYACKALSNINILRFVERLGASAAEVDLFDIPGQYHFRLG